MGGEDDQPPEHRITITWRPDTDKPPKDLYTEVGFDKAWKRTLKTPYIYANAVYVVYAALILSIDLHPEWDLGLINNMYVGAAVVHVVNAAMYIWVWIDAGYPWVHRIMIPEVLNVVEASLYLATASMYGYEGSGGGSYASEGYVVPSDSLGTPSDSPGSADSSLVYSSYYYASSYPEDPILFDVQAIELTASIVEMLAACGWVITWYFTYQRVAGRGWTFDDPDMWSNVSIITPAVIYIVYNVQMQLDPSQYGVNFLYVIADKIYMFNAIAYFIASLRDVGWFWFMPTSGRWPVSWRRKQIDQITSSSEKALNDVL